jgi:hypothetical protein
LQLPTEPELLNGCMKLQAPSDKTAAPEIMPDNAGEFERWKVKEEIILKREELDLKRQELTKRLWSSPLVLALIGVMATILGSMVQSYYQNQGAKDLERRRFESALIQKATETADSGEAVRRLKFYMQLGFVSDENHKIAAYLANPDDIPLQPRMPGVSLGAFTPQCNLAFAGERNPPIDDNCGIEGGSSDPAKQAESIAKNNFCAATQSLRAITYQDLMNLQSQSPTTPKPFPDRTTLMNMGEGQYVSYIAFIKGAHYSDVARGEAVNCNIPGNTTNDIHIILLKEPNDDECLGTTAEISPHYRPVDWTPENLTAFAEHPIRVQGQLFFDGSHAPCSGSSRPNPKRASLWEIHPVYSVEVCGQTTIVECQSSAAKWTPLSQLVGSKKR